MRNALFLTVGILLTLVQSNLYRVLGPLHVPGITPNLVLPLVVFLGVHEHSMARGAILSAVFGYLLDIVAGAPVGFFTFIHVSIWWLARIAGVRMTSQTWLTRISLGFGFSVVEAAFGLILLAVFGSDTKRPVEIAAMVLTHSASTGLVAPLVFATIQRLHQASLPSGTGSEGGHR